MVGCYPVLGGQALLVRVVDRQVVEQVVDHDRVVKPSEHMAERRKMNVEDHATRRYPADARYHLHSVPFNGFGCPGVDEIDGISGFGESRQQILGPLAHHVPLRPGRQVDHGAPLPGRNGRQFGAAGDTDSEQFRVPAGT